MPPSFSCPGGGTFMYDKRLTGALGMGYDQGILGQEDTMTPTGWTISEAVPGTAYLTYRVRGATRYLINLDADATRPAPYELTMHGDDHNVADKAFFQTLTEAYHSVEATEANRVEPREAW